MIDTLQDLTNAVTTETKKGDRASMTCQSLPFFTKKTPHLQTWFVCLAAFLCFKKKKKKKLMHVIAIIMCKKINKNKEEEENDIALDHCN